MGSATPEAFRATWPAVADSVPAARHAVLRHLSRSATPDPPLSDVGLAVSEAVTNAVNHAYVGREPGDVHVEVQFTPHELEVIVEDEGRGMMPRPDSPGLGVGLPVIATVANRFDTRSEPGRGCRICMWFLRDPSAATLPG